MTAQNPHQINRLQLEITCSNQATAIATQARLSSLMEHQIPDLLEQVFNQYDRPHHIIRLDRLELDLGILPLDAWENELHKTLLAQFGQCLTTSLKHSIPQSAPVETIPMTLDRLDSLEDFLVYGQLPWHAHRLDFMDLDQLVLVLVEEVKARFGSLLERVVQHSYARDRLKFNLTPDTLNQLHHDYPDLDWHWLSEDNQSTSNMSESVQSHLIQLQEFLQSGQRLSTTKATDVTDLDGLVHRLLVDEPVALRQLLQSILPQPIARRRLWLSLSETTLSRILQVSLEMTLEDWELLQDSIVAVMEHLQQSPIAVISNATEAKRFRFEALLLQLLNLPTATLINRFRQWLEYELSPSQFSSNLQWDTVRHAAIAALSVSPFPTQAALRDCLWRHLSHFNQPFHPVADNERSSALPTAPRQEPNKLPTVDLNLAPDLAPNQDFEQAHRLSLDSEQVSSQAVEHGNAEHRNVEHRNVEYENVEHRNVEYESVEHENVEHRSLVEPEQTPTQQLRSLTNAITNRDRSHLTIPEPPEGMVWFVQNGGMVLLWTYLNRYFTVLHLIANGQFVSPTCQMQAIHHLELLVRGVEEQWQEYDLTLNKVLCEFPLFMPVDPAFNRNTETVQAADHLLQNVIKHWTIIQNTSVHGFRHSFLQREGKLTHHTTHWLLQVERKGYDVLLEHLPYPLGVIKLPWMTRPLYVEW